MHCDIILTNFIAVIARTLIKKENACTESSEVIQRYFYHQIEIVSDQIPTCTWMQQFTVRLQSGYHVHAYVRFDVVEEPV